LGPEHLTGIAAALDAAGALSRLTVRAVPDAAHCKHASATGPATSMIS
jgi:hypothetical protein